MKKYSFLLMLISLLLTACMDRKKADVKLGISKDTAFRAFFNRTEGLTGNDCGFTVPLSDNRVLWLYGDAYIDHYQLSDSTVPCIFQVRNTALVQPKDNWDWHQTKTLLSPTGGTLFRPDPKADDSDYFSWPNSGFQLGDTVFVYSGNFKHTSADAFGFAHYDDCWVKMKFPELTVAGYYMLQNLDGINFGLSFDKGDDGYIYTFGNKITKIKSDVFLARFAADNPYARWQFWDGKGWTNDVKKIKRVAEAASYAMHVAKVRNKYVLLSSEFSVGCDQGKHIYTAVSDTRTGPFTAAKTLYKIDETKGGHYPFFYAPLLHPEYVNDKDEILISYAVGGYSGCFEDCKNGRMNPDVSYRKRGIRVPLQLIDKGFDNE